jgi:hypothetical protein
MEDWKAAYTAGFFDGEGCVLVSVRLDGSYSLAITISQKFPEPLEFIQANFGGKITRKKHIESRPGFRDGLYEIYELRWNSGFTRPVLEAMLPYLVLKKNQAELALEYLSLGGTKAPVRNMPRYKRRLEIAQELKDAKRGIWAPHPIPRFIIGQAYLIESDGR